MDEIQLFKLQDLRRLSEQSSINSKELCISFYQQDKLPESIGNLTHYLKFWFLRILR
jgi:hypothetical protein